MNKLKRFFNVLLVSGCWLALSWNALAQAPGSTTEALKHANAQRPGSVLIFNYFSSQAPYETEDTQLSLTNTDRNGGSVQVNLYCYGVNQTTGVNGVTDHFLLLAPWQTATFSASGIRPNVTGYCIAVAVNEFTGQPIKHNYLIGSASIKLASGHAGSFNAQAIAARATPAAGINGLATLNFDGVTYDKLPGALAADALPSLADGNDTLLVVNNLSGNLLSSGLGNLTGQVNNAAGIAFGWNQPIIGAGQKQFTSHLTDSFPLISVGFSTVLPAGQTGWLRLSSTTPNQALTGAVFYRNVNAPGDVWQGATNLRAISLINSSLTIPVLPPTDW